MPEDKNQFHPNDTFSGEDQESGSLDSTRMDISVRTGGKEHQTRTQIRVGLDANDTIAEKLKGKRSLLDRLGLPGLGRLFQKFKSNKQPAKSSGLLAGRAISPKLYPYIGLWIAPPDWSSVRKSFFYLSRLFFLIAGTALIALLVLSGLTALESAGPLSWILIGAAFLALIASLLSIGLKASPAWFVGFPLIVFLILLLSHLFLFPSTDAVFLNVLGKSPAEILNTVFISILFFEVAVFLFIFPFPLPVRLVLLVIPFYGIAGFLINMLQKKLFEESWMGSGLFSLVPLFYVQPSFLVLQVFFPLFFLVSLFVFPVCLSRLKKEGKASWLALNILVLLLSSGIGGLLSYHHRAPGLLSLVLKKAPGLGVASLPVEGAQVELKTKNFEAYKERDTMERYRMELLEVKETKSKEKKDKKTKDKTVLTLKVTDSSGFPVFFLGKEDFILSTDGEKAASWDLAAALNPDPAYTLSFASVKPKPRLTITKPAEGDEKVDQLEFFVENDSPPLVSYEVYVDGLSIAKQENGAGQKEFIVPLTGLLPGSHEIEIEGVGEDGGMVRRERVISIPFSPTTLSLVSPRNNDSFADYLPVVMVFPPDDPNPPVSVEFFVDEQTVKQQSSPSFYEPLDLSGLTEGEHQLKAVVRLKNGEQKEMGSSFKKGVHPLLSFIQPVMGAYITMATPVELKVSTTEALGSLALFAGDQKIHDWPASESGGSLFYDWDTSTLQPGVHFLTAQAVTIAGVQSSDWVLVQTGEGKFKLFPPEGKEKVNYKKVVFVLDASSSTLDGWDGRPKWDWEREILKGGVVSGKLASVEAGLVVFGQNRPSSFHDCKDAETVFKLAPYNKKKVGDSLAKIIPKGISALYQALGEARSAKPQKIIVVTDGADSCEESLPAELKKNLGRSPRILLDVVTLGEVSPKEKGALEKLALAGGGRVVEARNGSELADAVSSFLNLDYQIVKGDEVVLSAPIDGKEQKLRPGDYLLKMDMDPPFEDRPLQILNGKTTQLKLSTAGTKSTAEEKKE